MSATKKTTLLYAVLLILMISARPLDDFPQVEITNGIIQARLYLPDNQYGYYRGSRFDWAGVMPDLKFQGHTYFGQWFDKYSPTLHDAIMGPVEAFYPVGFEEAKSGESFLKVGIGMLQKSDESAYSFSTPYPITNAGTWKVREWPERVEFVHMLTDRNYSYEYKKTVELVKGKPEMVLVHRLKNKGKRTIDTNVYNHNFFVMDNQPTGPDFTVTFPFRLITEGEAAGPLGKLQDNQILFEKELVNSERLFYRSVVGFGNSASDYDIKIENHKTGAAVRITSDLPVSKLVFWSHPKTLCPEPYSQLKVGPGETVTWKVFYQFYICNTK